MTKFKNKYRSETARAQWWNYANEGAYFLTICTAGRACTLGEVINNRMHLSPIGEIVCREWEKSFQIRSELFCDTFVIMPNHIHAILRIDWNNVVGTHGRASLQEPPIINSGVAYRAPKSISTFVAGFKSSATKQINEYRGAFIPSRPKEPVWQPRFHDRIIRNEAEYQRIFNYIENNILNWEKDMFYNSQSPSAK